MSKDPEFAPFFILPPCFGGSGFENDKPTSLEMKFRKDVKEFVFNLAEKLEIAPADLVIGMIPIALEICLERLKVEKYEDALESYHEQWHSYFDGVASKEMQAIVIKAYAEVNEDEPSPSNKPKMDWT